MGGVEMNDSILLNTGFECLEERLGLVEAERFIALIIAEPFDYTKWRKTLFNNMTAEELSSQAMKFRERT
jgi:hypothetical protein